MKHLFLVAFLATACVVRAQETETVQDSEDVDILNNVIDSIEHSFTYQYDTVELDGGVATIQVPDGYKFLNSEQSRMVLTDLWGNPPSETLGMLFPEDISPLSDHFTYAVEISYSEDGYIDDSDAQDIDYADLLKDMQKDATEANSERVNQGYEPITIVGWASPPYYDHETKKLHWAKELKFGGNDVNTLNYNIRVLGRKGFLTLNVIGDMETLAMVKNDVPKILPSVNFNSGYKYSDFDPKMDKVAAYGIGGLIAGKVLAKVGFFAAILKFWKIIAVAVVSGFAFLRKRLFGGGKQGAA